MYNQEDHRGVFEEKAFNYGAEKTMHVALVWDIVKWVLVVLVAGFIGQFGRVLALRLIERHRAKKAHSHDRPDLPTEVLLEKERLRATEKIEKKQAKAEVKKKKKEVG